MSPCKPTQSHTRLRRHTTYTTNYGLRFHNQHFSFPSPRCATPARTKGILTKLCWSFVYADALWARTGWWIYVFESVFWVGPPSHGCDTGLARKLGGKTNVTPYSNTAPTQGKSPFPLEQNFHKSPDS